MNLESRVFSNKRIQELMKKFIYVKADPRDRNVDRAIFKYKGTRYVPEIVFIHPNGEVIDRLEDRSVEGAASTMESVLEGVNN